MVHPNLRNISGSRPSLPPTNAIVSIVAHMSMSSSNNFPVFLSTRSFSLWRWMCLPMASISVVPLFSTLFASHASTSSVDPQFPFSPRFVIESMPRTYVRALNLQCIMPSSHLERFLPPSYTWHALIHSSLAGSFSSLPVADRTYSLSASLSQRGTNGTKIVEKHSRSCQ